MTPSERSAAASSLRADIEATLEAMTLEEQVALLAGADSWTTMPIPRLGIPAIKVTDGPNGARGGGSLVGGVPGACFPVGISLASTWNLALIEQIGQALGQEAQTKGARVLLAPTVNLHRSTLNGRNFECYSEDPYLTAQIAVAYIRGVQREGVAATVKHFVGNESEFERMTISSEIDERTLREVYLLPFESAVKEAGVWAIMAAYNKVNGEYATEKIDLLYRLLKLEWKFDGVVMSDWFATHSTVAAINHGLDLEMPGPTQHRGAKLAEAVYSGAASPEAVKDSARRMLRLLARVGAFTNPALSAEQAVDLPEHRALIRRAGAEGIVLLKNDGTLPLDAPRLQKIAVIGPNAKTAQIMGGGSAQINPHYRVSPYEGILAQVGKGVEVDYTLGCTNHRLLPLPLPGQMVAANGQEGFAVEYFNSPDLSGEAVFQSQVSSAEVMWFGPAGPGVDPAFSARFSARFTPDASGDYFFDLVSAGLSRLFIDGQLVVNNWEAWQAGGDYFGEGSAEAIGTMPLVAGQAHDVTIEYATRPHRAFALKAVRLGLIHPEGEAAIQRAVDLAQVSDVAIVCVGLNAEWDSEGQDRTGLELPGRQNELVERVAAVNPCTIIVLQTGAPVTMPWLDCVAGVIEAWYPGQECGNVIADVLFGQVNPSGKLPQTFPRRLQDHPAFAHYPGVNGKVQYGEGVFVGYRRYDQRDLEPLFAFGHGLSYTTFKYGDLQLSSEAISPNERLTVSLDVTNIGQRAGQEVVQLYVRDSEARVPRPIKELKGFAKIALAPGEMKRVVFSLDRKTLAYWDVEHHTWVAETGNFEALVGSSSKDIRAQASFTLTETSDFSG